MAAAAGCAGLELTVLLSTHRNGCELTPTSETSPKLTFWTFVPRMVALFWEALEPLGVEVWLEEISYIRQELRVHP